MKQIIIKACERCPICIHHTDAFDETKHLYVCSLAGRDIDDGSRLQMWCPIEGPKNIKFINVESCKKCEYVKCIKLNDGSKLYTCKKTFTELTDIDSIADDCPLRDYKERNE